MNRHYIYVLLDPFENFEWEYENKKYYYKPFYVGIGVDKRINVHTSPSNLKKSNNTYKVNAIENIHTKGGKVIGEKIVENISQDDAKNIEIILISKFGRICCEKGILTNISPGGDSTSANIVGGENIHSKDVFQYDLEGNFITKYDCLRCIPEILEQEINYNTIGDSCRANEKYFPDKCFSAVKYIWFYDYRGIKIKSYNDIMLQECFQFSKDFKLQRVFKGSEDIEKEGIFNKRCVYRAIKNNKLYKNFYWTKKNKTI